jgi:TetR/AcrR family transcriptional regulator, upper aerobic nicotinate degradation pathway regulator
MANKPKQVESEDTGERLVAAAKKIFAEKGYAGATVKEIADEAGVNVSLISYHFKGKEGLLRACVEKFGRERLQDSETILTAPENRDDFKVKLKLWMGQFLRCHVEDKNVCTILHRENIMENKYLYELFQGTFVKTFEAMVKFIEAAKKKGILRKDVDASTAAHLIFGFMVHMGRNQEGMKKTQGVSIADDKFRTQVAEQTINILLHGVLREAA